MAAKAAIFIIMTKEKIITIACIIFIGAFAYFGIPLFVPRMETPSQQPFWETSLTTPEQDLQAFGLTLNQSTLEDALKTFGNRVTLTIYETENGDQIEGYVRETQVGPFLGRMAFRLNSNSDNLHAIKAQIEPEKAPMSRNNSYKLTPNLINNFKDDTIFSLAFIPTHIVLTAEDVEARFGQPELMIHEKENNKTTGTTHYLYPSKGIDISIDQDKRSIIQYISPRYFEEKIIAPIKVQ